MASTPESVIKIKIKNLLVRHGVYFFMPVQTGFGPTGLDFHCVVDVGGIALAFFIEAKKVGGATTARQNLLIEKLRTGHKANVFVIDGYDVLEALDEWLTLLRSKERELSSVLMTQQLWAALRSGLDEIK